MLSDFMAQAASFQHAKLMLRSVIPQRINREIHDLIQTQNFFNLFDNSRKGKSIFKGVISHATFRVP